MLSQLKAWIYAAGAALIGGLAAWGLWNKKKAEKFEAKASTLEATVHAERVTKKVIKEKKKEQSSRRERIKEEVEKKDDKDFKGIDNLTDSNDW
jgi:uncharacterized membrane protein YebE (DUF533 family)